MKDYQSLSHTRWDCKYHVVFIPKRRKRYSARCAGSSGKYFISWRPTRNQGLSEDT
ncbi:hypothetical protein P3T23_003113 [Paraburkholderia sp. GAS448]